MDGARRLAILVQADCWLRLALLAALEAIGATRHHRREYGTNLVRLSIVFWWRIIRGAMTIASLVPLVKLLEDLFVENYALRATLGDLDGWDDSTVDGHKEKGRQVFAAKFAAVYRLANNPAALNAALENILRAKKPN